MSRFVKPETVRYDLKPDAAGRVDWIEIKKRLNQGERNQLQTAGMRGLQNKGSAGQEFAIDWKAYSFARTVTYLVRWSLVDDDDNQTKPNAQTIEALDPDTFDEIENLITAHLEAEAEARGKNGSASATA